MSSPLTLSASLTSEELSEAEQVCFADGREVELVLRVVRLNKIVRNFVRECKEPGGGGR